MHVRRVGLIVVALAAISHADRARAQLPGDFVAEYGQALERMQNAYSSCSVRGTISTEYPPSGRSIARRFTLRMAGSQSRIDARVTAQNGMDVAVGGTDIFLAQPGASLQAYRNGSGEITNQPYIEDGYNQATTSIRDLMPLSFPYTMGGQRSILAQLQSGDVKITSFKRGTVNGERMIQIKYVQHVDPDGRQGPWNCKLLIAPHEGYALRQFSRTAGQGSGQVTTSGTLSYTLNADEVPLLQQFDRTERRGGVEVERQTYSISKFDTERPKSYLFSADGF